MYDCCNIRYAKIEALAVDCPSTVFGGLSIVEHDAWSRIRSPARRATFLAGRLVAKRLLRQHYPMLRTSEPTQITIRSDRQGRRSGRPHVEIAGRRLSLSLSITHTEYGVLVACSNHIGTLVGVDLVHRRDLGRAFARTWLTASERNFVRQRDDGISAADIWAMKEAVYKACHRGESFEPRRIEIHWDDNHWTACYQGHDLADCCAIRTWRVGGEIAALALSDYPRTRLKMLRGQKYLNNPKQIG